MASSVLGIKQTVMDTAKGAAPFWSDAPRWIIVVLGVAYATGFLIVSTYLNSFGVQDTSGELLKLKYLENGFYFLLFFCSVIILTISLKKGLELQSEALIAASGGESPSESQSGAVPRPGPEYASHMYPQRLAIWINALVVIFVVVGFAPPQNASRILPAVAVLLVVALVGTDRIYRIGVKYSKDNKDLHRLIRILGWILLIALALLDVPVIWSFKGRLWRLLREEWLVLLVFFALIAVLWYVAYRGSYRRPEMSEEEHKAYMWTRVALGLPVYYLCVLSFSYGVYPYMSASKGGGYYADSSRVRLTLREDNGRCPIEFVAVGTECKSNDVVLIEENSAAVFIADPGEPIRSDGSGGVKCWTTAACRPKVIEIKASEILYLEHLSRAAAEN